MGLKPDLAIAGGKLALTEGLLRRDVLVRDGKIVALESDAAGVPVGRRVDASGLIVLPGFIDTHVHLMDPGATDREDFPAGTAAAAARGVTTIVEHTHANPVRTSEELREKRRYLRGRSHVDFGLAAHVWPDRIDSMRDTWRAGATFFKIFTCTTHGVPGLQGADLRRALATIASFDGICLIHCEDEEMTRDAEVALRAAGRVDPGVLPMWRSREAELTAVRAAVELILETGARATIAHVSSPAVAEIVVEGRRRGASLGAEACPQYFHLREDEVLEYGPLRKFTPPARNTSPEDESEMWGLLGSGALSHVATDHAPATREQKLAGDMWEAPFGLPGLDTTSRLLFDAVAAGRLTWLDVGLRYAWEPARLYGLEPSKGTLSVGADADIVLVDPDADVTIRDEDVLSKAGWTPFAGRRTRGDTVMVFLRGNEIARGGAPTGDLGGRFLHGPGADTD